MDIHFCCKIIIVAPAITAIVENKIKKGSLILLFSRFLKESFHSGVGVGVSFDVDVDVDVDVSFDVGAIGGIGMRLDFAKLTRFFTIDLFGGVDRTTDEILFSVIDSNS
jgi:hypothetical protein